MRICKLNDMTNGWFIGHFNPACIQTETFEVGYHEYKKGQLTQHHYHKKAVEINLIISGKMIVNDKTLYSGDIFIIDPYEVSESIFLEDTKIVIVKTPSVKEDKFLIK